MPPREDVETFSSLSHRIETTEREERIRKGPPLGRPFPLLDV